MKKIIVLIVTLLAVAGFVVSPAQKAAAVDGASPTSAYGGDITKSVLLWYWPESATAHPQSRTLNNHATITEKPYGFDWASFEPGTDLYIRFYKGNVYQGCQDMWTAPPKGGKRLLKNFNEGSTRIRVQAKADGKTTHCK